MLFKYAYLYFEVIFCFIFKITNWDKKMVRKSACKHDTTGDSNSEETNDFEMPLPFYKRMIKKYLLTSSSESEEVMQSIARKLHQSKRM